MKPDRQYTLWILAVICFAVVLLKCSGCTHITREKTTVVEKQVIIRETTIIQGQQGAMWTEGMEI
jgi:hypothetical protein